ncbi:hypothetical protein D3C72_685350 [compost metagenome]
MLTTGVLSDYLCRWANDPQHPLMCSQTGQIVLLNGAQGLGRGSIAGKDHQLTTIRKQPFYTFQRILIHRFKRAVTIRCTGIVAEINIVILRHTGGNGLKHGKPAIA